MHAPPGDWAQVPLGNHLAKITGVTHFLEHCAETLLVTASRRRREAHQVPSRVGVKQAEVLKDSAVRWCHGVVRLIDDDEEEILRAKLTEPSSSGSAERWD
jgi:hypothetical protein